MSQADGKNKLERVEFELGKTKSYKFVLNPEEYSQEEPSRSTVTQTKGGAWVDDFGGGLPTITIRGTTGIKKGGFAKFKELRDLIRAYYKKGKFGAEMLEENELVFHNHTDDEHWVVHIDPSGFKLTRSKQNPLVYTYEIRMICLRNAKDPHPNNNMQVTGDNQQDLNMQTSGDIMQTFNQGYNSYDKESAKKSQEEFNQAVYDRYGVSISGYTPTSTFVASNVQTSNGSVSNAKTPKTSTNMRANLSFFGDDLLQELSTEFDPKLSDLAIKIHKEILSGERRSFSFAPKEDGFNLRVYNFLNSYVNNDLKVVVSAVVLELQSIAFYGFTNDGFTDVMTYTDINRLINNIAYVIDMLGDLEKPPWELVNDFRLFQRRVMYIANCGLYTITIKDELNQIENAQSVGEN